MPVEFLQSFGFHWRLFFALFVSGVLLLSQFGVHWIAPICALSGSAPLALLLDLRLSQCQQFYHPNAMSSSIWYQPILPFALFVSMYTRLPQLNQGCMWGGKPIVYKAIANLVLRMTTAQGRTLLKSWQTKWKGPGQYLVVAAGPCVKLHNQLGPKQASAHSILAWPATWRDMTLFESLGNKKRNLLEPQSGSDPQI